MSPATRDERRELEWLRHLEGCVVCRLDGTDGSFCAQGGKLHDMARRKQPDHTGGDSAVTSAGSSVGNAVGTTDATHAREHEGAERRCVKGHVYLAYDSACRQCQLDSVHAECYEHGCQFKDMAVSLLARDAEIALLRDHLVDYMLSDEFAFMSHQESACAAMGHTVLAPEGKYNPEIFGNRRPCWCLMVKPGDPGYKPDQTISAALAPSATAGGAESISPCPECWREGWVRKCTHGR